MSFAAIHTDSRDQSIAFALVASSASPRNGGGGSTYPSPEAVASKAKMDEGRSEGGMGGSEGNEGPLDRRQSGVIIGSDGLVESVPISLPAASPPRAAVPRIPSGSASLFAESPTDTGPADSSVAYALVSSSTVADVDVTAGAKGSNRSNGETSFNNHSPSSAAAMVVTKEEAKAIALANARRLIAESRQRGAGGMLNKWGSAIGDEKEEEKGGGGGRGGSNGSGIIKGLDGIPFHASVSGSEEEDDGSGRADSPSGGGKGRSHRRRQKGEGTSTALDVVGLGGAAHTPPRGHSQESRGVNNDGDEAEGSGENPIPHRARSFPKTRRLIPYEEPSAPSEHFRHARSRSAERRRREAVPTMVEAYGTEAVPTHHKAVFDEDDSELPVHPAVLAAAKAMQRDREREEALLIHAAPSNSTDGDGDAAAAAKGMLVVTGSSSSLHRGNTNDDGPAYDRAALEAAAAGADPNPTREVLYIPEEGLIIQPRMRLDGFRAIGDIYDADYDPKWKRSYGKEVAGRAAGRAAMGPEERREARAALISRLSRPLEKDRIVFEAAASSSSEEEDTDDADGDDSGDSDGSSEYDDDSASSSSSVRFHADGLNNDGATPKRRRRSRKAKKESLLGASTDTAPEGSRKKKRNKKEKTNKEPKKPQIIHTADGKIRHVISKEEFAKRYPEKGAGPLAAAKAAAAARAPAGSELPFLDPQTFYLRISVPAGVFNLRRALRLESEFETVTVTNGKGERVLVRRRKQPKKRGSAAAGGGGGRGDLPFAASVMKERSGFFDAQQASSVNLEGSSAATAMISPSFLLEQQEASFFADDSEEENDRDDDEEDDVVVSRTADGSTSLSATTAEFNSYILVAIDRYTPLLSIMQKFGPAFFPPGGQLALAATGELLAGSSFAGPLGLVTPGDVHRQQQQSADAEGAVENDPMSMTMHGRSPAEAVRGNDKGGKGGTSHAKHQQHGAAGGLGEFLGYKCVGSGPPALTIGGLDGDPRLNELCYVTGVELDEVMDRKRLMTARLAERNVLVCGLATLLQHELRDEYRKIRRGVPSFLAIDDVLEEALAERSAAVAAVARRETKALTREQKSKVDFSFVAPMRFGRDAVRRRKKKDDDGGGEQEKRKAKKKEGKGQGAVGSRSTAKHGKPKEKSRRRRQRSTSSSSDSDSSSSSSSDTSSSSSSSASDGSSSTTSSSMYTSSLSESTSSASDSDTSALSDDSSSSSDASSSLSSSASMRKRMGDGDGGGPLARIQRLVRVLRGRAAMQPNCLPFGGGGGPSAPLSSGPSAGGGLNGGGLYQNPYAGTFANSCTKGYVKTVASRRAKKEEKRRAEREEKEQRRAERRARKGQSEVNGGTDPSHCGNSGDFAAASSTSHHDLSPPSATLLDTVSDPRTDPLRYAAFFGGDASYYCLGKAPEQTAAYARLEAIRAEEAARREAKRAMKRALRGEGVEEAAGPPPADGGAGVRSFPAPNPSATRGTPPSGMDAVLRGAIDEILFPHRE